MKKEFEIVLNAVLNSGTPSIKKANIDELIKIAAKNKILLQFLRVTQLDEKLLLLEEAKYRKFLENLALTQEALNNLDHVFIKLRKPVAYVPSDIDILILRNLISKAVHRLMGKGFRIEVAEPYCITMTRNEAIIDLYVYPTLGGIIYINTDKLFEYKEDIEFNGVKIQTLDPSAEALVTMAHSMYKERIYTLNDFFTVEKWMSKKTVRLAQELNCEDALKVAMNLNKKIRLGLLETPYKIPLPLWLALLMRKFQRDSLTRATSVSMLKTLTNKRVGKLLKSKLTRETY